MHLYFHEDFSAQIKYVSKRDKARTVSFQEKSLSTKFFEREKKERKEQLNLYLARETQSWKSIPITSKHLSNRRVEWRDKRNLSPKKQKKKLSSTMLSRFFIHPSKRSLFDDTIYYYSYRVARFSQFFSPPLVPRFVANSSNDGIYRFSRPILVYLFHVSYRIEDPPPLCELSR